MENPNPNKQNNPNTENPDAFLEFEDEHSENADTASYTDEMLDEWLPHKPDKNETLLSHPSQDFSSTEQFKIMLIFLAFACLVFLIVYLFAPHNTEPTASSGVSSSDTSAASSPISKIEPSSPEQSSVMSETHESSADSSIEESSTHTESEVGEPITYDYITKTNADTHYGDLILVNQYHECWADGEDTVSIYNNKTNTYVVVNATTMISNSIITPLNNLMDDFYEVCGSTQIMVTSAYRSYSTQVSLFNREVQSRGSEELAAQWVARPGYSEHQTGLVFDLDLNQISSSGGIDYTGTGIYQWVNTHCQNYGFIVRYAEDKQDITGISYEPWHFRYVGVPHATYMVENSLCLEEYIELLHEYDKEHPLKVVTEAKTWYVYTVSAHSDTVEIPVPADREYTISGDNCGYFVVCYEDNT